MDKKAQLSNWPVALGVFLILIGAYIISQYNQLIGYILVALGIAIIAMRHLS